MPPDLRDPSVTAAQVIAALGLQPHPEGGHYRETWRDAPADGSRGAGTAIYFLLAADEFSHWHRVDAAEAWHWYAGGPLALSMSPDGHDAEAVHLGPDLSRHQRPFAIVPKGWWQSAVSLGRWTLVGCTVSPAFDFAGFELAPPDWRSRPRAGRGE
ncbi:cupin domain-containing protein [Roseomonas sp. JC162]|uniref:Cupin domain-containing protein n=1 Tax=Neoroseomonas marina TaxID=1232220 RepID=A0A848EBI0_9PROT|nr:cupin domain-containing protein [Neoroseomonas marina]NMJ40813.1 cupin domain-containing protein [Neoroseomonas marina]